MNPKGIGASVAVAVVVLAFLSAVFGTWYTVDQSERAVLTTNGAYTSTSAPGLHFKLPFFQSVTHVSMQQQAAYWGFKDTHDVMQAYSRDQQPADLRVSVLWHALPDKLEQLYQQYGGDLAIVEEKLISRKTPQAVKTVFGQYTAVSAIQERAKFNLAVSEAVQASVDHDAPIVIDNVNVENIDYSDAYEQSVESRMLAEVEVQKRTQELAQEQIAAQIVVTKAKGVADANLAQATQQAAANLALKEAEAKGIRLTRTANADGIRAENVARLEAIKDNPAIIDYIRVTQWNGVLPTTMIPGGSVPMLNLGAPQ